MYKPNSKPHVLGSKKEDPKADKKNWYNDRYQFVLVQRNILALITLLSLLCSIAATFSISQLTPLKSVEPFVIQIDQRSGVTQVVEPLKAHELTANEAVNNYFMVQYIRARESYAGSLESNNFNYDIVRVMSDQRTFAAYQQSILLSNPKSPAARLGKGGLRQVHISSIKFFENKDLAGGEQSRRYMVKVEITELKNGGGPPPMAKLIMIEFKYTDLDLSAEDRYLNPIGFRVLSYTVDDDNLTQ